MNPSSTPEPAGSTRPAAPAKTDITHKMIPNRANYSGKTRRTSKIHWRKGRSTVTGQSRSETRNVLIGLSCANESEPLPACLSHQLVLPSNLSRHGHRIGDQG